MSLGLGPVFRFEWISTARNWRVYLMRLLFGLGLLAMLWMVASEDQASMTGVRTIQQQAEIGRVFAATIVTTELVLLLLIAPAATASTLCLDKARGTLAHVLTTDLTAREIIVGKLAARILPSIGLIFSSLGIMAICTLMGGIDPVGLTGAIAVVLGVTLVGASLSLCLSVWASKTHEVVMISYLILIAYLMIYPGWYLLSQVNLGISAPPEELQSINPFWLALKIASGATPIHQHFLFLLGSVMVSVFLCSVAMFRLRAVSSRQLNGSASPKAKKKRKVRAPIKEVQEAAPPGRRWTLIPRPSLDGNPVLWREWQRRNPSRWSRLIWRIYIYVSVGTACLGMYMICNPGGQRLDEAAMIFINGFQISLGLLLMSVSAATSLAEERVRGSLDVLLTTTIPTRSIVWGKWWGSFRTMPYLAILPGFLVLLAACLFDPASSAPWRIGRANNPIHWDNSRWLAIPLVVGLILAYGAAMTSFGLIMATWISRLDRAVMCTVSAYVFMVLIWPIIVMNCFSNQQQLATGISSASPFVGVGVTGLSMLEIRQGPDDPWHPQLAWATFWVLAYLTVAALLFKLEISRFDSKLGRTPDDGIPTRPKAKVVPASRELALSAAD